MDTNPDQSSRRRLLDNSDLVGRGTRIGRAEADLRHGSEAVQAGVSLRRRLTKNLGRSRVDHVNGTCSSGRVAAGICYSVANGISSNTVWIYRSLNGDGPGQIAGARICRG